MCSFRSETQSEASSIDDLIGEWGVWQCRSVLLIFLCKIPAAWFMACVIFTAPFAENDEFYCKEEISSVPIYIENSENNQVDLCRMYVNRTKNFSDRQHQHQKITVPPVESWNTNTNTNMCNFTHHSVFNSLVTQFDLVCSREILIALTQFFHLWGVLNGIYKPAVVFVYVKFQICILILTGGLLATYLLKHISPKNVFIIGIITQTFCGCLTGIVNNFKLHIFFRCLTALCCCQTYTAGAMIFSDICGGKYRQSVCVLFESFWGVGIIILPLIVNLFQSWNWSHIYLAISLPSVIYILIWFWMPDSPKWLLSHGKLTSAKKYILYAIEVNKKASNLPSNFDSFLQQEATRFSKEPSPAKWQSLWSSKTQIIVLLALHTAWAVDVTNYNGLLLNIRVFGRNNLIMNTILCGICEILGVFAACLIVLNSHKHKFLYSGLFNVISGTLSFLGFAFTSTLSETMFHIFGMTLTMISKIATTCSQAVLFSSSAELLPEVSKRNICMLSCIVWARIWLLTAPFIGSFTFIHNIFPLAVFGFIELCGGFCSCIVDRIHNASNVATDEILKKADNSEIITTHM